MTNEELLADLIKTNIINILQWNSIEETEFSPLTPFQREIKNLADKYGVPSPFAKNPVTFAPPPVPEGKVRNG